MNFASHFVAFCSYPGPLDPKPWPCTTFQPSLWQVEADDRGLDEAVAHVGTGSVDKISQLRTNTSAWGGSLCHPACTVRHQDSSRNPMESVIVSYCFQFPAWKKFRFRAEMTLVKLEPHPWDLSLPRIVGQWRPTTQAEQLRADWLVDVGGFGWLLGAVFWKQFCCLARKDFVDFSGDLPKPVKITCWMVV